MDDFEEIMSSVSQEGVSAARPVIKILTKMWQSARDDLKEATARANRLRVVSILAAALASICLACFVYLGSVVHRQQGEINAIHRILEEGVVVDETATTETVTTQTIEGDTATINNGSFEQYNDNALALCTLSEVWWTKPPRSALCWTCISGDAIICFALNQEN